MSEKIDIQRCRKALANIRVSGIPDSGVRCKAISDAIAEIQEDGSTALLKRYIGVKQYAGFGDQRADCENGYSPSHGSIVFRIERINPKAVMGADEVYFLEALRDFGGIEDPRPNPDARYRQPLLNLGAAIKAFDMLQDQAGKINQSLLAAQVESHEVAT